jgi:N-acylneuraminate cytidylyltransferase
MIRNERVLAVVAARGGSKSLPRKNLAEIGGRPVVAWSCLAAKKSTLVDRAVLSTDDPEIAEVGRSVGIEVPFLRPPALGTDDAPIVDAVLHALQALDENVGLVVLLQAATPFRRGSDIDAAISRCVELDAPACLSLTAAPKAAHWATEVGLEGRMSPLFPSAWRQRRQELPATYLPNGAVYVARPAWLARRRTFASPETVAFVMPPERSVDIDDELDLLLARAVQARFGFLPEV